MSQRIIPACIPKDLSSMESCAKNFSWLHEIHIDMVDGRFVENKSWPYTSKDNPMEVADMLRPFTVEVDLMVETPNKIAEKWIEAGAQMLVFHIETLTSQSFALFSAAYEEVSIGVSAYNDTPWETLVPYLKKTDYVQVMGIAEIGAQGASFDERCLSRIAQIRKEFPELPISVDGSMNLKTIPKVASSGVDRFVVGSALVQALDKKQQYEKLVEASTV